MKKEIIYNQDLEIKNKTQADIEIIPISLDGLRSLGYINDLNYESRDFIKTFNLLKTIMPTQYKDNVKIYDVIETDLGLYSVALTENMEELNG